MPKKNPWWCKMDFQEFRHHYKKMSDEAALADLRASCEAVDDLDDSGTSWGALCVRSAKERLGKLSPVNAANAKSSGDDPQRGDGGSGNEVESPATPADAVPEAHKLTSDEETFIAFREAFPGTRRTWPTEFARLKKHRDWKAALPLLMPALEKEKAWRRRCADIGAFCPEWTMLSTWINQRRWEQELAAPCAPAVKKTARQLENEKNDRETLDLIQSLGKEKSSEPKGFLDDLSRDLLGGMKIG
jgi:hypothetical protein